MTTLGDSDEDNAEKQMDAQEPQSPRGGILGHRSDKNAQPLVSVEDLSPALRTDEIVGAEVRSSNDKIIGEVRSIVFDFKEHRDYAIVASGGFFTPGKESIVVPVRSLKVSENRESYFVPMLDADVKKVPLMLTMATSGCRTRLGALGMMRSLCAPEEKICGVPPALPDDLDTRLWIRAQATRMIR